MTDDMLNALNNQIRLEFESAFLYLRLSAGMQEQGLPGFAHWLRRQYQEECNHALKLLTHLEARRMKGEIPSVRTPDCTCADAKETFELVCSHERKVSAAIDELVTLAREQRDYATEHMLMWFVAEQVEEEKNAADIMDSLRFGETHDNLQCIDRLLAKRQD